MFRLPSLSRVASTALIATIGMSAEAIAAGPSGCNTVRVVVPFGAGGGSDVQARVIVDAANRLGATPNLQVVNITGQGGVRGAREVLKAKPDGCTLLYTHRSLITSYLSGHASFTWSDFQPIVNINTEPVMYAANPAAPFNNLSELQKYAQKNPNKVLFAPSLGSNTHFFLLMLQDILDIKVKAVGYDGSRERMTALLAHTVDAGYVGVSVAQGYLKSGKLKPLAIFSKERNPLVPEVPTAIEQGFDMTLGMPRGMVTSKGTPQEIINYYEQLFKKVSNDLKFVEQMHKMGNEITFMQTDEYMKWWAESDKEWTRLAKEIGLYRVKK